MSLLFLLLRGLLKHTRKKTRANKSINITKVVIQDKTWPCSPYIYIYFIALHYITMFRALQNKQLTMLVMGNVTFLFAV